MADAASLFKRPVVVMSVSALAMLVAAFWLLSKPKNTLIEAIHSTQRVLIEDYGQSFVVGSIVEKIESGRFAYARTEGKNTVGKAFLSMEGYLTNAEWHSVDFKLYEIAGKELREIFKQSVRWGPKVPSFAVPEQLKNEGEASWQAFLNKNSYQVVEKQ